MVGDGGQVSAARADSSPLINLSEEFEMSSKGIAYQMVKAVSAPAGFYGLTFQGEGDDCQWPIIEWEVFPSGAAIVSCAMGWLDDVTPGRSDSHALCEEIMRHIARWEPFARWIPTMGAARDGRNADA